MGVVPGLRASAGAVSCLLFAAFSCGLREIPAQLGQTVALTCQAQDDELIGLFLTRSDLDPRFVFVFRDKRPDLTRQNHLFLDRVALPGPLVANGDGNVVLYLSNVSWSDSGTYSCTVHSADRQVETSFDVRVVEPDGGDPPTEVPQTEDPSTGDPPTEVPQTEDPSTGDPPTEVPQTEDPSTGDPPTEDPPTEDIGTVKFILIPMYVYSFLVACFVAYILIKDYFTPD